MAYIDGTEVLFSAQVNINEGSDAEGISEWDYVITDALENISQMSGRVLVKGINEEIDVTVPTGVKYVKFVDSNIGGQISGHSDCIIEGLNGLLDTNNDSITALRGFGEVRYCKVVALFDCGTVLGGEYYKYHLSANYFSLPVIRDCKFVNYLYQSYNVPQAIKNESTIARLTVRNVCIIDEEIDTYSVIYGAHAVSGISSFYGVSYINCTKVDGDTCDGYYTADDNGKVETVNDDGTKSLISVVEKITGGDDFPRLYGVDETGEDDIFIVDNYNNVDELSIPRRNSNLSIFIPNEPVEDTDAVNKAYVDAMKGLVNQNAIDIYSLDSRVAMQWESIDQISQNTYTKTEIDSKLGDIDSVLDSIIAKQTAVIGGEV